MPLEQALKVHLELDSDRALAGATLIPPQRLTLALDLRNQRDAQWFLHCSELRHQDEQQLLNISKRFHYQAVQPPSTGMSAPVTYEEWSESKKSITPAASLGSPILLR